MRSGTLVTNILSFYGTLFIPGLYLAVLACIWYSPNTYFTSKLVFSNDIKILGIIVSFLGIIFWISAYWSLKGAFGVLPGKKAKVTRGLYKYINHPMYVGIFLTFSGLALAAGSIPGLMVNWFVLTPINWLRAKSEEKLLYIE